MKILSVIATIKPEMGGPAEAVKNIAQEACARGHDYHVVSCDLSDADYIKPLCFPHLIALGPGNILLGYSARMLPWLKSNCRRRSKSAEFGIGLPV
jgi:hypothetical protein